MQQKELMNDDELFALMKHVQPLTQRIPPGIREIAVAIFERGRHAGATQERALWELARTNEAIEGLGAWSRSVPVDPGHYWVWQDAETWPCKGSAHCVLVEPKRGRMVAWVPFMDFADEVVCIDHKDTWMDAWWLGPVSPPEAPSGLDAQDYEAASAELARVKSGESKVVPLEDVMRRLGMTGATSAKGGAT